MYPDKLTPWEFAVQHGSKGYLTEMYIAHVDDQPLLQAISAEQLTRVPLSLLIRDVSRHECDFFHSSRCMKCEAKMAEIDRRMENKP